MERGNESGRSQGLGRGRAGIPREADAGFEDRLQVRPGLTGLAQVYESKDNAHEKLNYDLEYLQRMRPWLDMKLLVLSMRNTLWVEWDRRSVKTSDTNGISDSLSKGGRQQRAAREGHVETNGGL